MNKEPEIISVTDLRGRAREILESAHFRGKHYLVERAGQPMVVVMGVEEYRRFMAAQQEASVIAERVIK
ncbi:MAG: type II toxin-antitoxin system prevent-host-death family antitoxin [Chloroflexi bacterium]|nr:type II toxin-antitoxin system prevent-host-death family antitoxin [Chloroflexota bacterium]